MLSVTVGTKYELSEKFKKELREFNEWLNNSEYVLLDEEGNKIEKIRDILSGFEEPSRNKLEMCIRSILDRAKIYKNNEKIGDIKLLVKEYKELKNVKKEKRIKISEKEDKENSKRDKIRMELKEFNIWLEDVGYDMIDNNEGMNDINDVIKLFKQKNKVIEKKVMKLSEKFKKELDEFNEWMKKKDYKISDNEGNIIKNIVDINLEYEEPMRNKMNMYIKQVLNSYNIYKNNEEIKDAKMLVKRYKDRKHDNDNDKSEEKTYEQEKSEGKEMYEEETKETHNDNDNDNDSDIIIMLSDIE